MTYYLYKQIAIIFYETFDWTKDVHTCVDIRTYKLSFKKSRYKQFFL